MSEIEDIEIEMISEFKLISNRRFNTAQPCASDMHNGCDKCEPKSDTVEVPVNLVRDLIKKFDLYYSVKQHDYKDLVPHVDKLEELLKEQSK